MFRRRDVARTPNAPKVNEMDTQTLDTLVKAAITTVAWYVENAPDGKVGDRASVADFFTDLAIKLEQAGTGMDAKALLEDALEIGFGGGE